jgi:hypothetical protein
MASSSVRSGEGIEGAFVRATAQVLGKLGERRPDDDRVHIMFFRRLFPFFLSVCDGVL